MIEINWRPTRRELRQFAVALLVATLAAGTILWWRLGPTPFSVALWVGGPILAAAGWIAPRLMRPIFIGLSLIAFPIGVVVGFVALAVVYYAVVTPIALLFRIAGRDPLDRRFDRSAASYWTRRPDDPPAGRYFRQF